MITSFQQAVLDHGIIAICRGLSGEKLLRLSDVLYEAGIRFIEVTYNHSDPDTLQHTGEAISQLVQRHSDLHIGAGTVLTQAEVFNTQKHGGTFIVSPNTNLDVIRCAKAAGMGSVPGAMTPSEIVDAYDAGADVVKLFPADQLGPAYIKAIRSPLNHIPLLATGGVDLANFESFLKAGCCGAGLGGSLTNKKMLAEEDWAGLAGLANGFVEIFRRNHV